MILHKDIASFTAAIQTASERLQILPVFIEKDYWITWVLKRLSLSKFNDNVVFKGGTSLSKAYKLIDRFSEDIDIAVLNVPVLSGNQVKNLIRDVEKDISAGLSEIHEHPGTSKGSLFRKSYYTYPKTGDNRFYQGISNKLIIEINSFANPIPFEQCEIFSLIGKSLSMSNQNTLIEKYELMPFMVNVLEKNQTLLEKLVSLFRVSFEADAVSGISVKIRHFYDLYYLLRDNNCKVFVNSKDFPDQFSALWDHDQEAFDEPISWKNKSISESPLFLQFHDLWEAVKSTYKRELSALAYTEIPSENKISEAFIYIMNKLRP
ncbi:MAG TPA: nucleotidyl transferase AbiEii/AbiGii toxin family protein [Bacteroidales bacterium]|nr:nucleotidyl transferase AbiEii/AbiGii toxin family protein [Bacteroidales bacterium]